MIESEPIRVFAILQPCYNLFVARSNFDAAVEPINLVDLKNLQVRKDRHVLQHNIGGRSEGHVFDHGYVRCPFESRRCRRQRWLGKACLDAAVVEDWQRQCVVELDALVVEGLTGEEDVSREVVSVLVLGVLAFPALMIPVDDSPIEAVLGD